MVVEGDFQGDKGLSMEPVAGVVGAREGKVEGNQCGFVCDEWNPQKVDILEIQ